MASMRRKIPAVLVLQARLKYLISEWGVEKFRSVVEQYYGKKLQVRWARGLLCDAGRFVPCFVAALLQLLLLLLTPPLRRPALF